MDAANSPQPHPPQPHPPQPRAKPASAPNLSMLGRALRSIWALMLREMSTTYGRSAGGYLWALLEPGGTILFMTIVISTALQVRSPALGESFTLFYASGMFPFMLYLRISAKVGQSIPFSQALLAYPGVAWIDAVLARFVLGLLTIIVTFAIVIAALIYAFDLHVTLNFAALLDAVAMGAALSLGVGMLMAYVFPTYPVAASLWSIVTGPLLFVSGVIFLYDDMPSAAKAVLWYNPLVHVIGEMRKGFFADYQAEYVAPQYVYLVALITLTAGLVLLKKNYRDTYLS